MSENRGCASAGGCVCGEWGGSRGPVAMQCVRGRVQLCPMSVELTTGPAANLSDAGARHAPGAISGKMAVATRLESVRGPSLGFLLRTAAIR